MTTERPQGPSPTEARPGPSGAAGASRVYFFRHLFDEINGLRRDVQASVKRSLRWQHRFWAVAIALILTAGIAIAAITSTTRSFTGVQGEVYSYDESSLTLTSRGMSVNVLALSAVGNSLASAVEMDLVLGSSRTALGTGNWTYVVEVAEAGSTTITSGNYSVELFVDGTSKGMLYMKQGTSLAGAEGVSFTWDLGVSLPGTAAYVVKIQAA